MEVIVVHVLHYSDFLGAVDIDSLVFEVDVIFETGLREGDGACFLF